MGNQTLYFLILLILVNLSNSSHHKPSKEAQLKGMIEYAKVCSHDLVNITHHDYSSQVAACSEFNCVYEILEKMNNTLSEEQKTKSCIVL